MKRLKLFVMMFVAILFLSGCSKSYLSEISYDEYKKLVDDKETFILEVMSDDCINCTKFSPKLEEVANEYEVTVYYMNAGKLTEDQLDEFGVTGTPTVLFYIDGEEKTTSARIIGNVSKEKIISKFTASDFIKE